MSTLTGSADFRRLNPQLFPNEAILTGVPDAVAQRNVAGESVEAGQDEAAGTGRRLVRIERLASRKLDKDNLYGGAKFVCDALRHHKLIRDDDPDSIELVVTQRKVRRKEVGTLIIIEEIQ